MTFEAILSSCIVAVEHGKNVESCLAQYPAHAEKLEPLLRIVVQIHGPSTPQIPIHSLPRQNFNSALRSCIDALEEKKSVDLCLATYPQYADRLKPMLQLAAQVQSVQQAHAAKSKSTLELEFDALLDSQIEALAHEASTTLPPVTDPDLAKRLAPLLRIARQLHNLPQSRLSRAAFVEARKLVAHAAINFQTEVMASAAAIQANGWKFPAFPAQQNGPWPKAQPAQRPFSFWPVTPLLATAASLLLVATLLLQTAAHSLPGDTLYSVKRSSEELQSYVILPFVKPAEWHMSQVERRVQELVSMDAAGRQPDPQLVEDVKAEVEQVFAATDLLPQAEREPILTEWFQWLMIYSQESEESDVVASVLAEPMATAESVLHEQGIAVAIAPVATLTVIENEQAGRTNGVVAPGVPEQTIPPFTPTPQLTDTALPPFTPTSPQGNTDQALAPQPTPTQLLNGDEWIALETESIPTEPKATGQEATPITTPSNRMTPTATPQLQSTAIGAPTSAPLLLPTITSTPAGTPEATAQPVTILLTVEPTVEPTDSLLPTVTPTPESTNAPLTTVTATPLPTKSSASEPTNTPLPTATPTAEPTNTPEPTATDTPQATNTPLPTASMTPVPTDTPESTATHTPEPTPTNTPEPTTTNTPEPTATNSPEPTATHTPEPNATNTPEPTATNTPEPTATNTPEPTATNTPEPTATNTPEPTATNTPEPTATNTPEPTATNTPEPTATNTPEPTATNTPEPTATNTPEPTATNTPEPTATNTPEPTATNTPEPTATNTPEPTATNTPEPTATNTPEPTATNTPEPTATNTPEPTATNSPEPTATPTDEFVPVN